MFESKYWVGSCRAVAWPGFLTCKSIPSHPREILVSKVWPTSELSFPIYATFLHNRRAFT
jgi:hypothetical protein